MRKLAVAALAALLAGAAMLTAPNALAAGTLTVGMGFQNDSGMCSVGFFAFNGRGDRLAVTAGHCAHRAGETIKTTSGARIGTVVSWLDDESDSNGRLGDDDDRGFTIIALDKRWGIKPFFASSGDPKVGQKIAKFGERTGKTAGTVTRLWNSNGSSKRGLMDAKMVQLPGDSGCPWYYSDSSGEPVLAGISSSGNFNEQLPENARSTAQTITGLYKLISTSGSKWTDGFKIWVK